MKRRSHKDNEAVAKTCTFCGKRFTKEEWEKTAMNNTGWKNKKYCSAECRQKSNQEMKKKVKEEYYTRL